MSPSPSGMAELAGYDLGTHVATFDDGDAILYALAVGAGADQLDLVFERELRVIPTFGCALGLWAVEAAGELGAYARTSSLHVGQSFETHGPLLPGSVEMRARVADVWDKGKASLVNVEVSAAAFTAGYTIFLPRVGDWGGERGPSTPRTDPIEPSWSTTLSTSGEAAVLYRLTGDRHPVHVDPEVAGALGFERPILHGLATLGMAARALAGAVDSHPADLLGLDARLAAPVLPGQDLVVSAEVDHTGEEGTGEVLFEVAAAGAVAVTGTAVFA